MYIYKYIFMYLCTYIHICTHKYTYTHVYILSHIFMYIYMYTYMYVLYIYIRRCPRTDGVWAQVFSKFCDVIDPVYLRIEQVG